MSDITPTSSIDNEPTDTPSSDTFTVTIDCDPGNEYDGRLGLRVSAIFVILVGSLLGTLVPILLARSARLPFPRTAFFIAKYFGSGVIIATAFIHLLAPAVEALGSPCLDPDSPITQYSWPEGIALMTVFVMFFIEVLASRFDIIGMGQGGTLAGRKGYDPAMDLLKSSGKGGDDGELLSVQPLLFETNGRPRHSSVAYGELDHQANTQPAQKLQLRQCLRPTRLDTRQPRARTST